VEENFDGGGEEITEFLLFKALTMDGIRNHRAFSFGIIGEEVATGKHCYTDLFHEGRDLIWR